MFRKQRNESLCQGEEVEETEKGGGGGGGGEKGHKCSSVNSTLLADARAFSERLCSTQH
jgi:hypothetical protein